jgi:hypothetical protein
MSPNICRLPMRVAAGFILVFGGAMPDMADEHRPSTTQNAVTQTAGVDDTKMGAYRALAQLSFHAFQKGDHAMAAELATILERTWDVAEEGGGPRALIKSDKDLFDQIDKAMDIFVKPVIQYAVQAPNPAAVEAAYKEYLGKLQQWQMTLASPARPVAPKK